jgi:hypothetical protein
MMKRTLLLACACLFLAAPAAAQVGVGGQVSWADDADIGVGARIVVPLDQIHPQLSFVPSFDVFFPGDDLNYWELNANLHYSFPQGNPQVVPYVGTGLNYARVSFRTPGTGRVSSSDLGVNLLGGIRFPMNTVTPFAELKFEIGGGEQFVLTGGLTFSPRGAR